MAKYRVKVLGVQGMNNKVYKANEQVTSENFPEGVADKLCNEGHLELINDKEAVAKAKAEETKAKKEEAEAVAKAKAEETKG